MHIIGERDHLLHGCAVAVVIVVSQRTRTGWLTNRIGQREEPGEDVGPGIGAAGISLCITFINRTDWPTVIVVVVGLVAKDQGMIGGV